MPAPPIVLVVDDDAELREVLRDVLEEAGYGVEDAASGRAALEHLRSSRPPPTVILLDQAMPDMDGATLIAELEQDPVLSAVPVLLMTGLGRASSPPGVISKVHAFLQKPLRLSDVLSAVGSVGD
jgi:CheY-like chemotaxis protein